MSEFIDLTISDEDGDVQSNNQARVPPPSRAFNPPSSINIGRLQQEKRRMEATGVISDDEIECIVRSQLSHPQLVLW